MLEERLLPTQSTEYTTWAMLALIFEWLAPQILNDLGIDAGNTNNAYLLSHLPPTEDSEAASSIIYTTQLVIVVIPSSFLYVLPVLMKHYMPEKKSAAVTAGILFAIALSLPGVIFGFLSGRFFSALGVKDAVCQRVNEYFTMLSGALPLWMIATSLSKVAAPLNFKNLMYIESLINFIFVTGFSNLFVNIYPLPRFTPIQIIALSNLVCSAVRIIWYIGAYSYLKQFEKWQEVDFRNYIFAIDCLWKTGWKLCMQLGSELFALYFLPILTVLLLANHVMNLAVLNVMSQCFIFSIIITLSMAITAMHLVNDFKEKGEYQKIRHCINMILMMSVIYNTLLFIIIMARTGTIVDLFMNPENNTNTGLSGDFRIMFMISYLGLVFNAFKDIINMSQRAMNIFSLPMKVSIGGVWGIGIPLAILLATCTDLGIGGLWLGYNIGNIITGLFLLSHWNLVSQPEVVQEIFSGNLNKSNELDQVSYCFKYCRTVLFPSNNAQNEESPYLINSNGQNMA